MTPQQIAALEAPFQEHELESKPGRYGKMLTYVKTAAVTRRLNQVFASAWSLEVTRLEVGKTAVLATVRLTAEGIAHEQAGGQTIDRDHDGNPIELGDDCKAAISSAMKKAAQLFGIGLYLCEDEPEERTGERNETAPLWQQAERAERILSERGITRFEDPEIRAFNRKQHLSDVESLSHNPDSQIAAYLAYLRRAFEAQKGGKNG